MNDIASDCIGPMPNLPHLGELIREGMEELPSSAGRNLRQGRPSRQPASSRVSTAPLSMRVQPVVSGYGSEQTMRTPSVSRSLIWK